MTYDLSIAETPIRIGSRRTTATSINATVPGPLLRFREGDEAVIRVTNALGEDTSVHWHGILVPPEMDGVPGVSFPGIRPGEVFEYRYPIRQYGTYWYHSHSAFQEQLGHYGPMILDPADGYPYTFDREYVVMLADWTFMDPHMVLDKLKKQPDYFQYNKRTLGDFFRDVAEKGLGAALRDRRMWARMRMNPTDISDITGATYTFLMNALDPEANWTGLFRPGERVLLRFINAAAATYFDVRLPGLPMTVVQVSGQFVQPVETDEIRIAIAETYDVIVQPAEERAYTIFAEAMDRSGYARGTLAPREGMSAPIPERRKPPVLTMADMGMAHGDMEGMDMPGMDHGGMAGTLTPADTAATGMEGHAGHVMPPPADTSAAGMEGHAGHDMGGTPGGSDDGAPAQGGDLARYAIAGIIRTEGLRPPGTLPGMLEHEPDTHGPGNAAVPEMVGTRLSQPGVGVGNDGWRVLVYSDLRALHPRPDFRAPDREIELHLTGNMERFMWSINGKRFGEDEPIRLNYGERLRLTMVNDTMMNHPMHLHGMWMELENGHGELIPRVHTVNVQPAERLSLLVTVDAPGRWAFHCHILYHMDAGMFQVVEVPQPTVVEETR
jgi:CopA family copper-resistance protein